MSEVVDSTCINEQIRVMNRLKEDVYAGRTSRQCRARLQWVLQAEVPDDVDPRSVYEEKIRGLEDEAKRAELPVITTITMVSHLGTRFDLPMLYHALPLRPASCVMNVRMAGMPMRGDLPSNSKKKKGCFLNQLTMDLLLGDSVISLKLFVDGKVQLAGARSVSDARKALEAFVGVLRGLRDAENSDARAEGTIQLSLLPEAAAHLTDLLEHWEGSRDQLRDFLNRIKTHRFTKATLARCTPHPFQYTRCLMYEPQCLQLYPIRVMMINTTSFVATSIDRNRLAEKLHALAQEQPQKLRVHYNPSTYAAVKTKLVCTGSGCSGCTYDALQKRRCDVCKDVSLMSFHRKAATRRAATPKSTVLITGARSYDQILQAYSFWTQFVEQHKEHIVSPADTTDNETQKIQIPMQLLDPVL